MREGILRLDGDPAVFLELVGPEQRQNSILMVSENDVSTGVELNQNVVGMLALAKLKVDNTIDAQLIDRV